MALAQRGIAAANDKSVESVIRWYEIPDLAGDQLTVAEVLGETVFACSVYGVQNPDYVVAVEQMIFT